MGTPVTAPRDLGAGLAPVLKEAESALPSTLSPADRTTIEKSRAELVDKFKDWDAQKASRAEHPDQLRDLAQQLTADLTRHLDVVRTAGPGVEVGFYAGEMLPAVAGLSNDVRALQEHSSELVGGIWALEAEGRQAPRGDLPGSSANLGEWVMVPLGGVPGADALKKSLKGLDKAIKALDAQAKERKLAGQLDDILTAVASSRALLGGIDARTRSVIDGRLSAAAAVLGRTLRKAVLS
jgi:hypothetical protein